MFNDELRIRTFNLTVNAIKILRQIPENQESKILKGQLIRSISSLAANFRASCVSRSKPEWYSKMSIVIEETDETLFWIELIEKLYPKNLEELTVIKAESQELVKKFSKARGKLGSK
jgi:four helix bundle protein